MREFNQDLLAEASKTVAMLAVDGVEKAKSGHPGMPMGAADYGVLLWLKYLNFNPADPTWINRDRFVLSNGHGSMFLYAMLHLSGYEVSLEDLKQFRQWGSKTPGHPENFITPGVECTTGPLGQGVSNAVGMAIGQKLMAARYNSPKTAIFDHRVYAFVGDGCLMEGVSCEASSLAGHLGLGNLIVLYDDNQISIAGHTDLAFTEDVEKRYEAYGWHTLNVDGHNFGEIDAAIAEAVAETGKPSLIACRTTIGKGSPNKANTHGVHGAALGADEVKATKEAISWPLEPEFHVPDAVKSAFAERVEDLKAVYAKWQESFEAWKAENKQRAESLEAQLSRAVPADLDARLLAAVPQDGKAAATRKLSGAVLQVASEVCPALIGGSADLEPSTLTLIKDSPDVQRNQFEGKNLRFGVREHGMGAIMNGLSYYGGFVPYGSTFLCFADYMRPAIRLAALSHLPGLFIFTHDSVFLGEDGPTHQPIEHVNSLRMIPNLYVFRPADGVETAICYSLAISREDGPSAFALTRQNCDFIEREQGFSPEEIKKGAYTVYQNSPSPEVVLVASGSEVGLAISSAKLLNGVKARVVSIPCWELFAAQPESYRTSLIPEQCKIVTVEAGTSFGWQSMISPNSKQMLNISIDRFGASAPYEAIAKNFGFTPEAVSTKIKSWLA